MGLDLTDLGGLPAYCFPGLAGFGELTHGVFTRQGGVSTGAYQSLNLSFAVGDEPPRVERNLDRVQEALRLQGLVGARQVHGSRGMVLSSSTPSGPWGEIPGVDLLITRTPGLGLLIKQADCQAVLLYDPEKRVVANAHCGWRGQVQNLLGAAVLRLKEEFACRPEGLRAAIGPGLGPCCAEFRRFKEEFPPHLWSYQVRPGYFDLWRLSQDQLTAAGLKPEHIELAGLCTRCRAENFFSYRRDRVTGRQGVVIALRA